MSEVSLPNRFQSFFNEKNLTSLMRLFNDGVVGIDLFSNKTEFSSISELENIYSSLFEINPNVKCDILETIETDSNLILVKNYYDFSCGAKSKTVWNITLKNGKIQKILHFSKNTPGK